MNLNFNCEQSVDTIKEKIQPCIFGCGKIINIDDIDHYNECKKFSEWIDDGNIDDPEFREKCLIHIKYNRYTNMQIIDTFNKIEIFLKKMDSNDEIKNPIIKTSVSKQPVSKKCPEKKDDTNENSYKDSDENSYKDSDEDSYEDSDEDSYEDSDEDSYEDQNKEPIKRKPAPIKHKPAAKKTNWQNFISMEIKRQRKLNPDLDNKTYVTLAAAEWKKYKVMKNII